VTREECEGRLECREKEVQVWKEEANRQKVNAANLNRRVQRFDRSSRAAQKHLTPFCRFDGRLSRAADKAVEAEKRSSNILEVKDEHGIIKDWAWEGVAQLVAVDDVPASRSFQVFKTCATMAGKEVVGSWDRRSVPRIMHEVSQAAEVLIVERFLGCIGSSSMGLAK